MSSTTIEFSCSMWTYLKSLISIATDQFNTAMDDEAYVPVQKITLSLQNFLHGLYRNNDVNASDGKVRELQVMLFKR